MPRRPKPEGKNIVIDCETEYTPRSPEEIKRGREAILRDPKLLALARDAKRFIRERGMADEIDTSWIPDEDPQS